MRAIVVDLPLLDSLKSICKTSFDHVEVDRKTDYCTNVAGSGSATRATGAADHAFDHFWKIIECSPGRGDIARRGEASADKEHRCLRVERIDGESSQFGSLRIVPQTQHIAGHSNIGRDTGVARVEFLCSLRIVQRALPFTAPAINPGTKRSRVGAVRLQFQCAVEFCQRILVLAMPPIKEQSQRKVRFRRSWSQRQSAVNEHLHLLQSRWRQRRNKPVSRQSSAREFCSGLGKVWIECQRLPVKRVGTIICVWGQTALCLVKLILTA